MKSKKWPVFVVSFIVVYGIAFIGSLFTSSGVQSAWYQGIRPPITPPNYMFPIVWNILFFLIALSLAFSWIHSKGKREKGHVMLAFGINLVLNALWSALYFGLEQPLLAFFDIVLILVSIIYMIIITWEIDRKAALMLAPYLVWVNFAAVLNFLSI